MPVPEYPITRTEQYLDAIAGGGQAPDRPITRIEQYLDAIRTLITLSGEVTAADLAELLEGFAELKSSVETSRISSLDSTQMSEKAIHVYGTPVYVPQEALPTYAIYNITDKGWYIFARIAAKNGVDASSATVSGADGHVLANDHVDVAIRFEVAAVSKTVAVTWGGETERFTFVATDLAIRNLDYRVTFYVYSIESADPRYNFATWEYALTTDTTFSSDKYYYTKNGDTYTIAEVTAGETVPADTYYNHSKVTFSGMTRNITYVCNTPIDCPVIFELPEIEDDTHGAWFEIRFYHTGSFSSTLIVPEGVKVATEHTQPETKGFNNVDLHYASIAGVKAWRFLNTHSSIPA